MAIDPKSIKIFKKPPIQKELPTHALKTTNDLTVYLENKKRFKDPDKVLNISLPAESLYAQNLKNVLRADIEYNLKDFDTFLDNPGKYRIIADNGYYIATTTNIYFISNDNLEKPVSVTKFFGIYLIACDRGEDCWLEEIK